MWLMGDRHWPWTLWWLRVAETPKVEKKIVAQAFPCNGKLNRRRDANKSFITVVLNPVTRSVMACSRIAATELNYDWSLSTRSRQSDLVPLKSSQPDTSSLVCRSTSYCCPRLRHILAQSTHNLENIKNLRHWSLNCMKLSSMRWAHTGLVMIAPSSSG